MGHRHPIRQYVDGRKKSCRPATRGVAGSAGLLTHEYARARQLGRPNGPPAQGLCILPATMRRVGLRELSPRRVRGAVARRRHRSQLVSRLSRGGVGAEIGTWEGDFSAQLLKRLKPQRLYLIDPWEHRTEATYERAFFGDRTPGGQAKMDAIHQGVERRFSAPITAGQVVILRM